MAGLHMVPLARPTSGFEAKVLAARLGAEGIVWQLRGDVDGMYPVGGIEVLVDEHDLERARELLLVDDLESAFAGTSEADGAVSGLTAREWWIAVALLAFVGLFIMMRLMAVG